MVLTRSSVICYIIAEMEILDIYFEKESYGIAVARALAEEEGSPKIRLADSPGSAVLRFSGYPPLSQVLAEIDRALTAREEMEAGQGAAQPDPDKAAGSKAQVRPEPRPGDPASCALIAFSSCCGGCGLSTVSRLFADQLARLGGQRTLWLSFGVYAASGADLFCYLLMKEGGASPEAAERALRRCLEQDEYGAFAAAGETALNGLRTAGRDECLRMAEALCASGLFDSVVMDLPFGFPGDAALLSCCERVILVDDPLRSDGAFEAFRADMGRVRAEGVPEELFTPPRDDGDLSDIHGQLGSAVRKLLGGAPC